MQENLSVLCSRGAPVIVLEDAAKPPLASNRTVGMMRFDVFRRRWPGPAHPHRRGASNSRVWPLPVVVVGKLADQVIQVLATHHDEAVQALGLKRLDEPLDVGVQVGAAVGQTDEGKIVTGAIASGDGARQEIWQLG
jgi:hypothetical protein